MANLPKLSFDGKIHIIKNNDELTRALEVLSYEAMIGFDTESRPAFKRGQYFPISTIQFSTLNHAFIIQKTFIDVHLLTPILESESIKKVGIALHEDLRKMGADLDIVIEPKGFIDLSEIARKKGIIQIGARSLAARYLKKTISKSAQTSNWAKKHLDEKQIIYAATDAWICLKIYPFLINDHTDYHKLAPKLETDQLNEENID